jgi:hypothetical protein
VSEFLVETYASYETRRAAARHVEEVSLAAAQVSEAGTFVRLQRASFAPADDISFNLLEACQPTPCARHMTRAGLRSDPITDAVSTTRDRAFS